MYKIEKGVDMTAVSKTKYPFREMEVGDSFVADQVAKNRIYQASYNFRRGQKNAFEIKIRSIENSQIRVFRIA